MVNLSCNGQSLEMVSGNLQYVTLNNGTEDFVKCQSDLDKAIKLYNEKYAKDLPTANNSITSVNEAANTILTTAFSNMNQYLDLHKDEKNLNYAPSFKDMETRRKQMKQKIDILKSINGAPKEYNTASNIYDDYRTRYNNMIYITITVSLLVVVFLYIYFKLI